MAHDITVYRRYTHTVPAHPHNCSARVTQTRSAPSHHADSQKPMRKNRLLSNRSS